MPKVHANGIADNSIFPRLRDCLFKLGVSDQGVSSHHSNLQNCSGRESWGILLVNGHLFAPNLDLGKANFIKK